MNPFPLLELAYSAPSPWLRPVPRHLGCPLGNFIRPNSEVSDAAVDPRQRARPQLRGRRDPVLRPVRRRLSSQG